MVFDATDHGAFGYVVEWEDVTYFDGCLGAYLDCLSLVDAFGCDEVAVLSCLEFCFYYWGAASGFVEDFCDFSCEGLLWVCGGVFGGCYSFVG